MYQIYQKVTDITEFDTCQRTEIFGSGDNRQKVRDALEMDIVRQLVGKVEGRAEIRNILEPLQSCVTKLECFKGDKPQPMITDVLTATGDNMVQVCF